MNRYIRNCLVLAAVIASVVGIAPPAPQPAQAQTGTWYVSNSGSDANACNTPAAPCATIQAAVDRAESGDTVRVAVGTYRSVVTQLRKSITLVGGWDEGFTTLIGFSALDGMNQALVLYIGGEPGQQLTITGERLVIQNGQAYGVGGISIASTSRVALNMSVIKNNVSTGVFAGGNNIMNGGVLALVDSEVTQNRSLGFGAFSLQNSGTLTLTNSTIKEDSDDPSSGVIENVFGTVQLLNSTIQVVSKTGIRTNSPSATTVIRNSVLTAIGNGSSVCSGTLQSLGYNVINNVAGCNFVAAAGDLQNVDPKLSLPFGIPTFFTLMPDSPAIDAGDPTGCKDHLGNPLLTDQRGNPRALEGNGDSDIRCDIGSFEYDYENPLIVRQAFLPSIAHNYCANFFDDFSNSLSGWPTGESDFVLAQYLNGEYRVQSKQPYLFLFRSPACERDNYVVEADMRWNGATGGDIGLLFGVTPGFSQYYFVDINTDFQAYGIFRRNSNGTFSTVVPAAQTSAIRTGTQTNHIEITRNGVVIALKINGQFINSWYDNVILGPTRTGVAMAPYDDLPVADARFDNFRVTTIGAGILGLPSLAPAASPNPGQPLPADFPWRLPEHELTFPQP